MLARNTFYRWRQNYGGMELSDVKRLKQADEENRQLRSIVASQALEIAAMKAILQKKW